MKQATTYNFKVKLEYLDEYKPYYDQPYYTVDFQVLAEDIYKAQRLLERWLENPEQTGWKYKAWLGIRPMPSSLIVIEE